MARTDFSLANSKFNDFLFEPIGDDARGTTISMFSGLARLHLDPWLEAARIAALPVDLARQEIADRIGQLNVSTWDIAANIRAAARLVKLLPIQGAQPAAARSASSSSPAARPAMSLTTWAILLMAIAAMLVLATARPSPVNAPSYGDIPGLDSPR